MVIMGLDGSMTAFGWAVVELGADHDEDRPKAIGCVRTGKETDARHVYQADDDGRRIDEIADALILPIRQHKPRLLVIEAPAGAQHAASAKALGASYAISRTLGRCFGIPAMTVQAFEPIRMFLGRKNASKLEVEQWCLARWPDAEWMLRPKATKPEREGAFDALSVAACGARSAMAGPLRPEPK